MTAPLEELRSRGVFSPLDEHFARTLERISGESRAEVVLAAALASRQVAAGHVCVDLSQPPPTTDEEGKALEPGTWPDSREWAEILRSSKMVGAGDTAAPLILDSRNRLYLKRYWEHERELAALLSARTGWREPPVDRARLRAALDRFFPRTDASLDWQRVAAAIAVLRRFTVISGGPGTGKTYTVAKILALLVDLALAAGERAPRVALLAPTGKAAARLQEAIGRARAGFDCADEVRRAIPAEASTIHRSLAPIRGSSTRFRHGRESPLAVDAVVVDEASMVDLALMNRLLQAVPAGARLILLGDKDQLASVEAGAVLGDVCDAARSEPYSAAQVERLAAVTGRELPRSPVAPDETSFRDSIVELVGSRRYDAASGLGLLARAIHEGETDAALELLAGGEVSLVEPPRSKEIHPSVRSRIVAGFARYLSERDPAGQLEALASFRVLCAHRRGPYGVETVNLLIEAWLREAALIEPFGAYSGRPVLITRNDHQLGLYNGDVGLIVADPDGGDRRLAVFARSDGELRMLSPSRLPPHETAFAMSVHKSQGSEFDEVVILLPSEPSPVMSRELLYTAVTRARARVTLQASRDVVAHAVEHPITRTSGLRDRLRRPPSGSVGGSME